MTSPDYPVMSLGGYETYQLAHIATFIADRLARHRLSRRGCAGRAARAAAVRDLALGAMAFDTAVGVSEPTPPGRLPQPLDAGTYTAARGLVSDGPRSAEVVSLAGIGEQGWAVVGHVPGRGPVGASAPTQDVAEALRTHILTRPVAELAPWAVTDTATEMPTLPDRIDPAQAIGHLDPDEAGDRAVAGALRGRDSYIDAAIRDRFRGVDLDAPSVVEPPTLSADASIGSESSTGPERADHEGGTVGNDGATVPDPDHDRGQTDQRNDPQQPAEQGVEVSQGDRQGRDQLDVAPPQYVAGQDRQDHRHHADPGRDGDGSQSGRAGKSGREQRAGQQGTGEHVRQARLPGVDHRSGRPEHRQRQQHRDGPSPVHREGGRDSRQGHDRRGLGPSGSP